MKIKPALIVIAFFAVSNLYSQISDNCVVDVILEGYSERAYTSEPVTEKQLDLILKCGIKAPSGRNIQPWRFTVVQAEDIMKEIINDVEAGNVLIIVSGIESESGTTPDFDCGLATENMFVAAHGLGLGARIYGSPARNINSKREMFQIPQGYRAIVVLRIGNVDKNVDAISSATTRKKAEEVIN
ncbi:MAG: nitroreductase family protein, partial [Bacteroidales bacterium]|nr:nitroreductase family protein [Bacteroidales bacterium]